jgi:CubicO group peptidase (beta-lactamase class C family)
MKLTRIDARRSDHRQTVSSRHADTGCDNVSAERQEGDDGRSWRRNCIYFRGSLDAADFLRANRNRALFNHNFSLFVVAVAAIVADPFFANHVAADESSDVRQRIAAVENGLSAQKGGIVRSNIIDRMHHFGVPGASVAVIHDYKIEWAKGYGVADRQTGAPVTRHTLFQAASTSKPVAALAALKLVERGVLHLDDDVNHQLKAWKVPANQFTREHPVDLRSLLSHTAGITVHGFGGYSVRERLPTLRQILDGVKPANSPPIRVDKVPGKGFRYSGGGTLIVQRLAMDVTNEPFPAVMQSLVLNPIGMASSTYEQPLPKHLRAKAASGHDDKGHPIPGKSHIYPEMQAAGLWTTPADMARYMIELQLANEGRSEKVLHREMINKMLTPQNGGPAGLGPFLTGAGAGRRFSHNGANAGFRCNFVGLLNRGDGAVVMTNSDLGDPLIGDLFKSIATVYGWPD